MDDKLTMDTFNYFKTMYYILEEGCFTGILDDLVLDESNIGEFDRFSGKNTYLIISQTGF